MPTISPACGGDGGFSQVRGSKNVLSPAPAPQTPTTWGYDVPKSRDTFAWETALSHGPKSRLAGPLTVANG